MRNLGAHEQVRRSVLARRDAGAAADARGGVHGGFRHVLRDENRVAVLSAAGVDRDVAARGDDPVEGAPSVLPPRLPYGTLYHRDVGSGE